MLARATFTIVTWDKEPVDEREGGPDVIGAQGNIPKGPHRGLATFVGKRILARAGAEAKKLPSSSFSSRNSSFPPPNSSFSRSKACPVPRYGAGIQGRGLGGANEPRTPPPPSVPNSHNLVCGWQPAWAIGMKARGPKPNRTRAPAFGQGG